VTGAGFDGRRFRALLRKETLQVARDPSTFLIAFVLPLLLLFLFGYGVSLDTARTRIGVAIEDHSSDAYSLASAFQHSSQFTVTTATSVQPLRAALVQGDIRGFVVIPQGFGADRRPIQIVTDGSLPNTANFVAAYAEGVRSNWAAGRSADSGERAAPRPIQALPRFWFNPELASRYFLVPGSIAIVMTIIGTLLTALVVAREWERGTLEALMATPMGMAEFLATKMLPYFLLGLAAMAMCTLVAIGVFGVPFRGSVFALLAIASAFLIPALGQGLFISSATKNQFVASQIALITGFLPSMMLSGFLFEISSMPRWIQAITYAVPARYLIPQLQTVFIVGDVWPLFLPNLAMLLLFGAIFFALSFRVTRRRIA
jgi:ABC-2 type transport system permease protein